MKRLVNIIFALTVLVIFAALLPINHDKIMLRWWSGWEGQIPLTVLLLFTFLIGMTVAGILFLIHKLFKEIERRESKWQPRVRRKAFRLLRDGEQALKKGEESDAEATFREAMKLPERFPEVHVALVRLYLMQGRKEDALAELRMAAAIAPDDPDLQIKLAELSLDMGDAARAVKALTDAIELKPNSPQAKRLMPKALAEAARWEEAVKAQKKLIKSMPKSLRSQEEDMLRAYSSEYARSLIVADPSRAHKTLSEVLKQDPGFLPAVLAAVDLQSAKDKSKEAVKILAAAFKARPEPFLYERLAQMEHENSFECAEELAEEVLNKYPRHHALRLARAKVRLQHNHPAESIEELGKISGEPALEKLLIETAALIKLGKIDEAGDTVDKAVGGVYADYSCSKCAWKNRRWVARCSQCGALNTMTTAPFE